MREAFDRFAKAAARGVGHPAASLLALLTVLAWLVTGFFVGFSDSHNLVINTVTTIITFLMVFIIQATQNRDTAEIKGMLREMVEDLPDVDEKRAKTRTEDEE